jgi:hypothetical protein
LVVAVSRVCAAAVFAKQQSAAASPRIHMR